MHSLAAVIAITQTKDNNEIAARVNRVQVTRGDAIIVGQHESPKIKNKNKDRHSDASIEFTPM